MQAGGSRSSCLQGPRCTCATPAAPPPRAQGGRVEVGAPTGRWQMILVYRGKHDPLDVTYLAALQAGASGRQYTVHSAPALLSLPH